MTETPTYEQLEQGVRDLEQEVVYCKQALQSVQRSEEQYRALVNEVNDGIFATDTTGRLTFVNKTLATMYGYEHAEGLVGRNFLGLVSPEERDEVSTRFRRAVHGGEFTGETAGISTMRNDGGVVFIHLKAVPITEDGRIVGARGVIRDVTERRRAKEALLESEEKFRAIAEQSPNMIFINQRGRIVYANRRCEEMMGYTRDEFYSDDFDFLTLIAPEHRDSIRENFTMHMSGHEVEPYEYALITKDGRRVEAILTSRLIDYGGGKAILGTVIDITEHRRAQEEKKRLQARLLQSQKLEAIATLAGGIAHQFNNALSPITASIDLLQLHLAGDKHTRKPIEAMRASALRMATLTEQLLAYARGGKYQPQVIALSDCVTDTFSMIERTLKPSIRVDMHVPQDRLYIEADVTQMQMVISAILQNSSEVVDEGGRILISATNEELAEEFIQRHPGLKPAPYACLTVRDNGKGMDEETRGRIFEPFFTTKFQGRGLAMAAVYGIVTNHNGFISVDSEVGKGTTVRIYLPSVEA